jgi:hypothetical protein
MSVQSHDLAERVALLEQTVADLIILLTEKGSWRTERHPESIAASLRMRDRKRAIRADWVWPEQNPGGGR